MVMCLFPLLNGGRTSPMPEVPCFSSGRKNTFETGPDLLRKPVKESFRCLIWSGSFPETILNGAWTRITFPISGSMDPNLSVILNSLKNLDHFESYKIRCFALHKVGFSQRKRVSIVPM